MHQGGGRVFSSTWDPLSPDIKHSTLYHPIYFYSMDHWLQTRQLLQCLSRGTGEFG